jgi:hypothetical protein
VEEIEGDFAGGKSTHFLRSSVTLTILIQLLESEVDRTPPRPTIDEFGDSIADTNGPQPMSPPLGNGDAYNTLERGPGQACAAAIHSEKAVEPSIYDCCLVDRFDKEQ